MLHVGASMAAWPSIAGVPRVAALRAAQAQGFRVARFRRAYRARKAVHGWLLLARASAAEMAPSRRSSRVSIRFKAFALAASSPQIVVLS